MALSVQIYLKMNRKELAEKMLSRMQQQDDDATLSQLAAAWVHIAKVRKIRCGVFVCHQSLNLSIQGRETLSRGFVLVPRSYCKV